MMTPVDVFVIGAHPDDIDLSCGGTILKWTNNKIKVGVLDLSRGELGTRGTPEVRAEEAAAAAKLLRLDWRHNLQLPDGGIIFNDQNRKKLVAAIRKSNPKLILSNYYQENHPDHSQTGLLAKDAWYLSGIKNYDPDSWHENFKRANRIAYYWGQASLSPSVLIDISDHFDKKIDVIKCFSSQFYKRGSLESPSRLSHPDFLMGVEARFRYWGTLAGCKYAEGFIVEGPVKVDSIEW